MSRSSQSWQQLALHPAAVTVEIVLVSICGVIASVFSSEIGEQTRAGALLSSVGLFWLGVVVSIAYVFGRRLLAAKERAELLENLRKLIRTQPPPNFLAQFERLFIESQYLAQTALQTQEADTEILEEATRSVLGNICAMAGLFNPQQPEPVRANLMCFVSVKDIERRGEQDDYLLLSEKFRSATEGLDGYRGFLRVVRSLSFWVEDHNIPEPERWGNSALPVPHKPFSEKERPLNSRDVHWHLLPGAPRAFLTWESRSIPNTSNINADWFRENTALSADVMEKTVRYFEDAARNGHFQAFVSLPVPRPGSPPPYSPESKDSLVFDENPIAILNIESPHSGFFSSERPVVEFSMIMAPFLELLGRLVEDWLTRTEEGFLTESDIERKLD